MHAATSENGKKDIGTALFGKGRRNVLAALFRRPDEAMYLREIIAAVGTGAGQVQRELGNLTQAGLILREKRANQVYYRPNPQAPIFEELKGIVFKTFGVADVLRETLAPFAGKIKLAFIFGSVARQEDTARSDIDVIIVGRISLMALAEPLAKAEKDLKREISTTIYTAREFTDRITAGQHFISRVLGHPKIFLIGDEDDLRQLAKSKPEKP